MISILLPTIRPQNIEKTVLAIPQATKRPYEIIVVADFEPNFQLDKHTKWIISRERRGTVEATNLAHSEAKGDYYFLINDEAYLAPNALDEMQDFVGNKLILTSPEHSPYFPFYYYKKFFAPFPFVSKRTLNYLCGNEYVFDPTFKAFYADPDLSMRAYENGVEVLECKGSVIFHKNDMNALGHQANVTKYLEADRAVFTNRWNHLGEFRDP